MATVLITGGTGTIGKALTDYLVNRNYQVIVLSRKLQKSTNPNISYALWDVEKQTIDIDAIKAADYIIHLAGAGVADKRWTAKRKQEILQSRTQSSALLASALKNNPHHVKAVISASAIGWYGPDTNLSIMHPFTEDAPSSLDFLGTTCKAWEESLKPIEEQNIRVVKLRTGIVLTTAGGALPEFMKPAKLGFATIMGNGKQFVSWIDIEDLVRMYVFAIENDSINGAFNAVAPNAITNKELMISLTRKIRGKFYMTMHIPAFALKLLLGEMSIEILKSTRVSAAKIQNTGFTFLFPSFTAVLDKLKASAFKS